MRVVLVLFLYPISVRLQCLPGLVGIPCISPPYPQQFQPNIKPYWNQHNMYGSRDFRRQQMSTPNHVVEKPRVEMNLRLPQIRTAISQPLQPAPQARPLEISGAVNRHEGQHAHASRRAHGLRSLDSRNENWQMTFQALNRDPIDSFERALGGDEFEVRKPVAPIRVIKVESAEVLEPMHSPGGQASNMHERKKKILESITRHMNQIHPPRVIPFQHRHDEIDNGRVIAQASEVKVSRIEPSSTIREPSSLEIADDIIDNIISKVAPTNTTELLQSLNATESASNTTAALDTSESVPGFEMTAELHTNDTNSPLVQLEKIDKSLEALSTEIQDYDTEEEWRLFSNPNGNKKEPPMAAKRPDTSQPPTSTSATTAASSTTSASATTTGSPPTTEASSATTTTASEDAEEVTTTTLRSTSTTSTTTVKDSADLFSEESLEELALEEETTKTSTTAATTTSNFNEDFKAAVREQQEEILRERKEEEKKTSKTEENDGREENGESAKPTIESTRKITELNSETIKSINNGMKERKRKKLIKTSKRIDQDKGEEVEVKEEEEQEKIVEITKSPLDSSEEILSSGKDDKEKSAKKKDKTKKKKVEKISKSTVESIEETPPRGENGKKKEKIKKKKVTKTVKSEPPEEDVNQTISEALKQNLRKNIASISKSSKYKEESREKSEESGEAENAKKQPNGDEEEEAEEGEEPAGAGSQGDEESEGSTTLEPEHSAEVVISIKGRKKGRTMKPKKKKEQWEKVEEVSVSLEEEMEATTEEPEKKTEKKILEKKHRRKGKPKEAEDADDSSTPESSTLRIKIGGDDTNIHTDKIKASLKDAPNAKYYYPPKVTVPLPSCFYNPSGYVCCNLHLNNLIEDTFEMIKNVKSYSACNIARMATIIQQKSEEMFGHPFESVVALSDFAQNVHFAGDLVCKVEIDGKYMLTYATPYDAEHAVEQVDIIEDNPLQTDDQVEDHGNHGHSKKETKGSKKSKRIQKKPLPIHNFRM